MYRDSDINEGNIRYEADDLIYLPHEDCYIVIVSVESFGYPGHKYETYRYREVKGHYSYFDDPDKFFEYNSGVYYEAEFVCHLNDDNITKAIGELL